MIFEFCVDSYSGVLAAKKHRIKRIELCASLNVGGLTPLIKLIKKCAKIKEVEIHVMLRPHEGSFIYKNDTLSIMLEDIYHIKNAGAKGVVFGCLTNLNEINIEQNKALIELAKELNLETTFHRAFDYTNNPINSLNQIIALGFNRLLTSGAEETAEKGIGMIELLVKKSNGQIEIMAGCGVNEKNVLAIAKTGVDAIHFTIDKKNKETNEMGIKSIIDEKKINNILCQF